MALFCSATSPHVQHTHTCPEIQCLLRPFNCLFLKKKGSNKKSAQGLVDWKNEKGGPRPFHQDNKGLYNTRRLLSNSIAEHLDRMFSDEIIRVSNAAGCTSLKVISWCQRAVEQVSGSVNAWWTLDFRPSESVLRVEGANVQSPACLRVHLAEEDTGSGKISRCRSSLPLPHCPGMFSDLLNNSGGTIYTVDDNTTAEPLKTELKYQILRWSTTKYCIDPRWCDHQVTPKNIKKKNHFITRWSDNILQNSEIKYLYASRHRIKRPALSSSAPNIEKKNFIHHYHHHQSLIQEFNPGRMTSATPRNHRTRCL